MKMLRAIIRPEKAAHVAEALLEKGFPSRTRMDVYGRGKKMGLQISLWKVLLQEMMVTMEMEESLYHRYQKHIQ